MLGFLLREMIEVLLHEDNPLKREFLFLALQPQEP